MTRKSNRPGALAGAHGPENLSSKSGYPYNSDSGHLDQSARLVIEHQTIRDRVQETYEDGILIEWRCIPNPPEGEGWEIADASGDYKTVWRRVRLADASNGGGRAHG